MDSAASAAYRSAQSFNDTQADVQEARNGFFEKLALFNAGTIAASVTLAAQLHQHPPMKVIWCLDVSWLLLLVSLVSCFARIWQSHNQRFYVSRSSYETEYAKDAAARAELVAVVEPNVIGRGLEQRDPKEFLAELRRQEERLQTAAASSKLLGDSAFKWMQALQWASFSMTGLGTLALVVFSSVNLR